jgi:hypothetical protein
MIWVRHTVAEQLQHIGLAFAAAHLPNIGDSNGDFTRFVVEEFLETFHAGNVPCCAFIGDAGLELSLHK